jgi:hypothetical protein
MPPADRSSHAEPTVHIVLSAAAAGGSRQECRLCGLRQVLALVEQLLLWRLLLVLAAVLGPCLTIAARAIARALRILLSLVCQRAGRLVAACARELGALGLASSLLRPQQGQLHKCSCSIGSRPGAEAAQPAGGSGKGRRAQLCRRQQPHPPSCLSTWP